MDKKLIIVAVVAVILVIGIAGYFMYSNATGDSVRMAFLNLKSGAVTVNGNPAVDNQALALSDVIKTGADGRAAIVLQESIIIDLDPGTEVSIKEVNAKSAAIKLAGGGVWSKFAKVSGMDSYSVETPNAVATVRGTAFRTAFGEGITNLTVGEGAVDFASGGQSYSIPFGNAASADGTTITQRALTPDELADVIDSLKISLAEMRALRRQIIDDFMARNQALVNQAKAQYNVDESMIDDALAKADAGEFNEDELIAQAPIKPAVAYRVADLNRDIRKTIAAIAALEAQLEASSAG